MLTVILTIMWRPICSADSYYDNSGGLYVVLTVIMSIKGMSICSVTSYCDNNGKFKRNANRYCDNNRKVYMQC